MRVIKFRAWHRVHRVMLYPSSPFSSSLQAETKDRKPFYMRGLDSSGNERQESFYASMTWGGACYQNGVLQDLEFEQFTGFLDKKGTEIYEGDIIKLDGANHKYEVVWNHWQWGIDSKGIVSDYIQGFTMAVEERAIILGNIFENPELLKA